jgi:hypothetical protein
VAVTATFRPPGPGAPPVHVRVVLAGPPRWPRLRAFLRGVWAVLVLFVTAADALFTALVGIAPLAPKFRQIGLVIAEQYRVGCSGAVDADVIELDEDKGGAHGR